MPPKKDEKTVVSSDEELNKDSHDDNDERESKSESDEDESKSESESEDESESELKYLKRVVEATTGDSKKPFYDSLVRDAKSPQPAIQLSAVKKVRKLVSSHRIPDPPTDDLIASGIVPVLVSCLKQEDNPSLQMDAVWALSNITAECTPQQMTTVVEAGAVQMLIVLLDSPHDDICKQAVTALGNIIGDGPVCRDVCIAQGIVEPLLKLIDTPINQPFVTGVTSTIHCLCWFQDSPLPIEIASKILSVLCELIHLNSNRTLTDAVFGLARLTEGGNLQQIQIVIDSGVVPDLVLLLPRNESEVQKAAMRAVGNLVKGTCTQEQKQVILDSEYLYYYLRILLSDSNGDIDTYKEALRFLSNITEDNQQVQAVIDAELLPEIIRHLDGKNTEVQVEAARLIGNIAKTGNKQQVMENNLIQPLCNLLAIKDTQIVLVGIKHILQLAGEDYPKIAELMEMCGGNSFC